MFEVHYLAPSNPAREERLGNVVARFGGGLAFREAPEVDGSHNVVLTYEFASRAEAEAAAAEVQAIGEYIEGPYQYT